MNFVSFHKMPGNVMRILTNPGWLGARPNRASDAQGFGGPFATDEGFAGVDRPFIVAHAAGMFFVPPSTAGEDFPGAKLAAAAREAVPVVS
jgi:hypothetical protein